MTEENPEPELLQQAITQVYQALLKPENTDSNNLLDLEDTKSIYKFISLLKLLGLKLNISEEIYFEKQE